MHEALPDGPLDIVGDVHGELEALKCLLKAAGYDASGHHPSGRTLVFIGDLVDRGPDSPGVVDLVRAMVATAGARAVLGNHEVNLLRSERKLGNNWFWNEETARDSRFSPCAVLGQDAERSETLKFFASLPLVLSRKDLRVTHAAWHAPSVKTLSEDSLQESVGERFERFDADADRRLAAEGWLTRADEERANWNIHLPELEVPLLNAVAYCDEHRQMANPIRVITSGLERKTRQPFFTSGQWRFAERLRWWDEYVDDAPVVIGHYWRQYVPLDRDLLGKSDPDLFEGADPRSWLGPRGNVFCVDFSVGGRYQERKTGNPGSRTRLALLRWPEQELVLDTGERVRTKGFGD
jgi:Calcineurin-like phosphoesterase